MLDNSLEYSSFRELRLNKYSSLTLFHDSRWSFLETIICTNALPWNSFRLKVVFSLKQLFAQILYLEILLDSRCPPWTNYLLEILFLEPFLVHLVTLSFYDDTRVINSDIYYLVILSLKQSHTRANILFIIFTHTCNMCEFCLWIKSHIMP